MLAHVQCSQCQKRYQVDAKYAGKKVPCKHCGSVIRVPVAELADQTESAIRTTKPEASPESRRPVASAAAIFDA